MTDFTIDDAVGASLQGAATQLRDSLGQALPVNPDAFAATRRDAVAAGVPIPTAQAMPAAVKTQAQLATINTDALAQKFPHTAQWLSSPDNAKLAHDDIPATTAVEQHVSALGAGSPGAFIGPDTTPPSYSSRLNAWLRDLVGLPPAGRDEGAAARAFLDRTAHQMGTTRQGLREAVGGMSPVPQQFAQGFMNTFMAGLAPDNAGAPDTTAGQIASGTGELAGFLLGAPLKVAQLGIEALPKLAPTAGDSFIKAMGRDMTRQAATLGLASGITAAGSAFDTGSPDAAAQKVINAIRSGAGMGAVFGAAGRLFPDNTILQIGARALGVNATLDAMSGSRPWDDRALGQKVFDYGLNAVFSLNGAGRTGGSWLHDAARADVAVEDAKTLGNLATASTASKLRERDPAGFRAFVASAAQESPVPAVYIDGMRLAEALHQTGIGPDGLGAKLPDVAQQLAEALSTGGQVRIPVEDFATHIAGGALEEPLMQHLRTDPEGMTLAESGAFYQSHVESLKAAGDALAIERAADEPFQTSRQQVFDSIKAQLESTGRFQPGVNDAYAALHRDFYSTMADRTGMLPHELLARYPVRIAAESPAGDSLSAPGQRGAFDPATKTIALMQGADLSTFLHESGHFFLDTMAHMAGHPDAPEGVRADMQTLLRSFNVADLDTWHKMSLDEQRESHEKFARGFEAYLLEGKAPSLEMRGMFGRFRSWLLNVYKSLTALKVDLSPEVRGVFDRMLASSDAIKHAETARAYMPLFDTPEKANMSPEEWTQYQALGKDATDTAIEALSSRAVRDMAWLDRTRNRALKALGEDAHAKRRLIQMEVHAQVMAEPVYRAWAFLTGRDRTGRPHDAATDPTQGAGKLKTSMLRASFGEERTKELQALKMTSEKGLDPSLVAEMFGFRDADQLTKALTLADHPRAVLEGMVDRFMLERHGEIADPQALARTADDLVHNEVRTRFIATELRTLKKAIGPARDLAKAAKEVAQATIARKRVRDVNERQFTAAETRAGKAASERLAAGDRAGAAVAKRDQLLNTELARAARDALASVQKGLVYLKRFDRDSIRKHVDLDIREQIDTLLERFDLRQHPPEGPTRAQRSLEQWIDAQRAAGYAPAVPADILDPAVRQHYKDMPVERFAGLVDSVKALEHIGRERKTLMIEGQEHDLDEYVNGRLVPKLAERGERFSREQLTERPEDRLTNPIAIALDHLQSWLRGVAAQLKPQEFKRNEYDRHELLGPFGEALTDPIINANYRKVSMLKGLSDDFQAAARKLGREWQDSLRETVSNTLLADPDRSMPGDNVPLRMTRGRMIGLALHVGNESNFGKLVKGWGWEPADVWRFLHENMADKDWQAVQTVWDLYGKHWPEMEAMNRRLGNESPDRIEPRAFQTKFGEMKGGYAAISYDALRSRRGEKEGSGEAINPAKGLFGRDYYRPDTTTNGSMNSRIEGYNDRVDLDFHSVARKIQESIHDLAYRETLINSNKVIEHPDFRKAFKAAYGPEAYQSLREWIGQLANSNNMDLAVGALGKFLQYTRTGLVINAIAFRATTVLKHGGSAGVKSLGYFAGGGEKYLAHRMAAMGTDYSNQIEGAKAKFGEIANRLLQQDRDFRATASTLFEPDTAMAKAHRFGHAAVAWSDMMTAVPTAWAAYDRAIAEGIPKSQGGTGEPMTETQAVNYANKTAREAHGSTAEAARSMVLNNSSEAMKMFTTLFGFMNNSYGQQLDGFDKLRTAGISNGPVLARTLMAIVVPAIWAAYISHGGAKNDETWAAWVGKAIAGEVASSVPFVRDAVGMVEGFHNAGMVSAENWLSVMVHAGKDAYHVSQGDGKGKPIRDFADAAGMGLHIPGLGQAGVTAQFLEDVRKGKEHPANAAEWARGLVTGHSTAQH